MRARMYSKQLPILYYLVKGKLVFGAGPYNHGIFRSIRKALLDFLSHY